MSANQRFKKRIKEILNRKMQPLLLKGRIGSRRKKRKTQNLDNKDKEKKTS